MEEKSIYVDHAATTKIRDEVFEAMLPYLKENYGNASSIYKIGRISKQGVEDARSQVAAAFNAEPREIFFTSSGTESDNWAIKGVAQKFSNKGKHMITTTIEHPAVLSTFEHMEKTGCEVTYLPVNKEGLVSVEDLSQAIRPDTILISVMFANNEIGTVQPIAEIAKIAKSKGILFHTDAVQAVGAISIDVKELGIDLLSISSHKVYGPKGVGALYIRKGIRLENLIHGGHQERGQRASTENVAGIVGFGKAVELANVELSDNIKHLTGLRDATIDQILTRIPYTRLNGSREKRLPGNVNISIQFIEGESILLMLDISGICASSGSACTSGSLDPSHVLLAIGLPHEIAHGSLRISYGIENTMDEVNEIVDNLERIVARLREMSPLWEKS